MLLGSTNEVVALNRVAFSESGSPLLKRGIARGDVEPVRRAVANFEAVLAANPPGDADVQEIRRPWRLLRGDRRPVISRLSGEGK
jgi:hypothetical protein